MAEKLVKSYRNPLLVKNEDLIAEVLFALVDADYKFDEAYGKTPKQWRMIRGIYAINKFIYGQKHAKPLIHLSELHNMPSHHNSREEFEIQDLVESLPPLTQKVASDLLSNYQAKEIRERHNLSVHFLKKQTNEIIRLFKKYFPS